jgi:hypothetical protein
MLAVSLEVIRIELACPAPNYARGTRNSTQHDENPIPKIISTFILKTLRELVPFRFPKHVHSA